MTYKLLFKGSTGPSSMDPPYEYATEEAARAAISIRAARYGNQVSDYSVVQSDDSANPKQAYGDKKLPVHLVPRALTQEAALNMRDGANKYGPYNWRTKKVEVMTYLAAIERHLASYLDGEDVDPESKSGATHLGAIAACVGIIADARNTGNLIDNRPPKGASGEVIRRAAGVVLPEKTQ